MRKDEAIEVAARAEYEYAAAHGRTRARGPWDELLPMQRSHYRAPARRIIEAYLHAVMVKS